MQGASLAARDVGLDEQNTRTTGRVGRGRWRHGGPGLSRQPRAVAWVGASLREGDDPRAKKSLRCRSRQGLRSGALVLTGLDRHLEICQPDVVPARLRASDSPKRSPFWTARTTRGAGIDWALGSSL